MKKLKLDRENIASLQALAGGEATEGDVCGFLSLSYRCVTPKTCNDTCMPSCLKNCSYNSQPMAGCSVFEPCAPLSGVAGAPMCATLNCPPR